MAWRLFPLRVLLSPSVYLDFLFILERDTPDSEKIIFKNYDIMSRDETLESSWRFTVARKLEELGVMSLIRCNHDNKELDVFQKEKNLLIP